MNTDRVRSIVRRFGSQDALAKKLEIAQTTVSAWVRNDRIPARRVADLMMLAQREGIELRFEEILPVVIDSPAEPERRAS